MHRRAKHPLIGGQNRGPVVDSKCKLPSCIPPSLFRTKALEQYLDPRVVRRPGLAARDSMALRAEDLAPTTGSRKDEGHRHASQGATPDGRTHCVSAV